jgi:predicted DNA-binding protein
MGEKKQLNVRIPLELQEKIETSGRSKVDIVIEALELYFNSKKPAQSHFPVTIK